MANSLSSVDKAALNAIYLFLDRIKEYNFSKAILFGSRARGTHTPDSDIDIAIVFRGSPPEMVIEKFKLVSAMSRIAYDVMLETDELINTLPIFENELLHPEKFSNPILIENIKREGIEL